MLLVGLNVVWLLYLAPPPTPMRPQVEYSNENLICFNLIIMFQKILKFKQTQVVLFVVMDDNNQ